MTVLLWQLAGIVGIEAQRRETAKKKSLFYHEARNSLSPVVLVCELLRKMRPEVRREAISAHLGVEQRLALEKHMLAKRAAEADTRVTTAAATHVLADQAPRSDFYGKHRGIFKSSYNGKVYGYYAKTGIRNLTIFTRISRSLEGAIQDHVISLQILHQVSRRMASEDFPTCVRAAVQSVLTEEHLEPHIFFRTFSVTFSAKHWVGETLWVYCKRLNDALDAWRRLEAAHGGVQLFVGGTTSTEYTPEKAEEQWKRVRKAYVDLRTEGGLQRSDIESTILKLETQCRPLVERTARMWTNRQSDEFEDSKLFQRFKRVVRSWDRMSKAHTRLKSPMRTLRMVKAQQVPARLKHRLRQSQTRPPGDNMKAPADSVHRAPPKRSRQSKPLGDDDASNANGGQGPA